MSATTSEDASLAKNAGDESWAAGDYKSAVENYGKAIGILSAVSETEQDKDFLKVVHSNRSAAYLKQGLAAEALNDANRCAALDSNWVKGYSRKGDALLAQRKYVDAHNAYNYGLRLSPGNSMLTGKIEQAMRAIRSSSDGSSLSPGSVSSGGGDAVSLNGVGQYINLAVVVCCALYMFPFIGASLRATCYRLAAGLFGTLAVVQVRCKHGLPSALSLAALGDYASRLLPDPLAAQLMLALVLLLTRPYLLPLAAVLLRSFSPYVLVTLKYLQRELPRVQGSIQLIIARFAPTLRGADLSQLISVDNAALIQSQLQQMSASCEVLQGVFLVLELVLPSRNLLQLYLWWQFLRMRYVLELAAGQGQGLRGTPRHVHQAFVSLDARISTILSSSVCPAIVRQGYALLKDFMVKQGQLPTEGTTAGAASGGGAASMLSKCSIM